MKKIAIFASGNGSNAENISLFFSKIERTATVSVIFTNNASAGVIDRSRLLKIPCFIFNKKMFFSSKIIDNALSKYDVDYIVLAGFLLKVPKRLISQYKNKIFNIHPSLLPKYGGQGMYGSNVHSAVLKNNESFSGITIHLVNEHFDKGKVLFQEKCSVEKNESVESLTEKIKRLEFLYYPKIIANYIDNEHNNLY